MLHSYKKLQKTVQFSNFRFYCKTAQHFVNRKSSVVDMEQNLTLYGDYASPPVRFVMVTASLLKIKLNFHDIDLFKSENKSEFYKKINPLQKVPTLTDGNITICDSHAIVLYLCRRSSHQDLYPSDDVQKALVDQLLYFNATTLFPIDSAIYHDYFSSKRPPVESKVKQWYKALDYLESNLGKHEYLVADKMLLCDLCCVQTIMSMDILMPVPDTYQRIKEWQKAMKNLPGRDINQRGLDRFRKIVKNVMSN